MNPVEAEVTLEEALRRRDESRLELTTGPRTSRSPGAAKRRKKTRAQKAARRRNR